MCFLHSLCGAGDAIAHVRVSAAKNFLTGRALCQQGRGPSPSNPGRIVSMRFGNLMFRLRSAWQFLNCSMSNFISETKRTRKLDSWLPRPPFLAYVRKGDCCQATSSGLLFSQEHEASKKGPRCCPSLGPWTTHCERSRSFARSIRLTSRSRFLFQTLIELKRKRAAPPDKGRGHDNQMRPRDRCGARSPYQ
jgi:hypothetical protein